ncbi:D-alanine--D-alanine ligase family protein [Gryllotalpicola reticulitermitis]|uniref:D-alanine--D-alanine ligase n=1 Tax=Gryllotalpicola reticulitermitis TaxID=1184153 RepID=A0ABV8Q522_9MICO
MTRKLALALLFGGRSSEHSVSVATAGGVIGALDPEKYDILPIGITRAGGYVLGSTDPADYFMGDGRMPEVHDDGSRVLWPAEASSRELTVIAPDGSSRAVKVDVVFPILHGRWGEDGTVQGMLELVDLPFVGSGVLASSLGMDKHYMKTAFVAAGLPVAPWSIVSRRQWAEDREAVEDAAESLGYPVFVKPARAGSSVGVGKATDASELAAVVEAALIEDSRALIEPTLVGREIEIAVLGSPGGRRPRASVAGEVVLTGREFYDFEGKYLGGDGVDLQCPARLDDAQLAEMQDLAVRAFEAIGAEGLSRVDFFLTDAGWVINEINTMPGFTPISMYPKCWEASGLAYPALIDELISLALDEG